MYKFKDGFYADVRTEERFTTSICYRNGALEESKTSTVKKAFIRVYDGSMWYYASTYRLDAVQDELNKLYAMATSNAAIASDPTVMRLQSNVANKIKFAANCVKDVPIAQKRKLLEDVFAAASSSEYVKMFVCAYEDRYSVYEFCSSKGADIKYDMQLSGAQAMLSLAADNDNFSDVFNKTKDNFSELASVFNKYEISAFAAELENFVLHAKSVQAGVYPVILSPTAAGVFAHESFGHKSEADFMLGDETMRREWQLGKKVGADILSIYDSGEVAGSGYVPFDDEGTATQKTYLIKNGVLTGRLHSAATASDLDEDVTGNARAINCGFEPIVRMTSTIIEAGGASVEELFSKVKHGYFIKSYKHGSGMSTFTIAPNLAYEIIDGKIGDPVKIAVISGNVFETLNLIDGLSDQVEVISSIFSGCGKMEQYPLNVSFGGPYVSVSSINVQ